MEEKEIRKQSNRDEISPDELMENFRGRSLKSIILFTVVVHAVLLLGTSIPYLKKAITGRDNSELTEDERMELAMKEATQSLRDIAEEHGVNVQDISGNFTDGSPKRSDKTAPEITKTPPAGPEDPKPESTIEGELKARDNGPDVPKIEDDEEDLFK